MTDGAFNVRLELHLCCHSINYHFYRWLIKCIR